MEKETEVKMQKQIVVRVDNELHDALLADAEANGRTLAQSVRFHLRATLLRPTLQDVIEAALR